MQKNLLAISILLILLLSQQDMISQNRTGSAGPKKFFVAKTAYGIMADEIKPFKIDAALTFTAEATQGKYEYIPFQILDSVFASSQSKGDTLTSLIMADRLQADFFVFVRINKLENMMRIDISAVDAKDTNNKTYGVGYSAIRYMKLTTQEQMTDPALLMATMRAFALAIEDTTIFVQSDSLKILPVPTLVIGGINYVNNDEFKEWEIYTNKEISSYDAVENIFDEIKNTNEFAVFDIQTRDTLYSLFNLMFVENHKSATTTELKTLYNMDVRYYVTGVLTRVEEGAMLDLYFCRILTDGQLEVLAKESNLVSEDSIEKFKAALRKTIGELIAKNPHKIVSGNQ